MTGGLFLVAILLLCFAPCALADTYSVENDTIGADTDVAFVAGGIYFTHGRIALDSSADVLGLSSGRDLFGAYIFSVNASAQGLAGTAVRDYYNLESSTHGASDDIFTTEGMPVGDNRAYIAPRSHPYDLDGYELDTVTTGDRLYFSVSGNAESGGSLDTNVIYTTTIDSASTTPDTFASANDLGLQSGDVIDAVAVYDADLDGNYEPGQGDRIVFSLTLGSTSFVSGYQLYAPGTGAPVPLVTSAALGLRDNDELNALEHTPEPTSLILLGAGLLGLFAGRRRKR